MSVQAPDTAQSLQPEDVKATSGWKARLDLQFSRREDCTKLVRPVHSGPLRVQRPFYPEGPTLCHVYVLHPPGGIVSSDELTLTATVGENAHVLMTTPGAAKLYRSLAGTALVRQSLNVAHGASLEWFPHETIAFNGARADLLTRVDLAPDALFIGWEVLCLGRPRAGEVFDSGAVRAGIEIWRDGIPLWIDCARFAAADDPAQDILRARYGLKGSAVLGTFLATLRSSTTGAAELDAARHYVEMVSGASVPDGNSCTLSLVDGVLSCRYLGNSTEEAKKIFIGLWSLLRPVLLDRPACAPRVWNT